ncbi:MLO-like protein 6 [Rutidosis leptorrhynchoides]|uniref:MLO-like protein 6 n=1 Tax=Rutidosis leptorrhynchoides TaxID=125765 RepID=UPI003A9A3CB7
MVSSSQGRSLEQTPTWALATVCSALIVISIVIEQITRKIEQWFKKTHKSGLYESLEKIKAELILMGFMSLLLSVGTTPITKICISESAASTWHPCTNRNEETWNYNETESCRRLLNWPETSRRILAGNSGDNKCAEQGKVSFISYDGVHQLHIFIFVLAVSHVLYCILTVSLAGLKMRSWNKWEMETKTVEYQFSHDSKRFRFARDTSFGRRHVSFWSQSPLLLWIVSFYRQFGRSVPKVDYLALRRGFIMAHLAPRSHSGFNFQNYINRSLEEDFKVVLEISPPIWLFAIAFLLFNTHGWYSYLWLPFLPLIIVLLVGTKLQMTITKMGLKFQERGMIMKGEPVVEPGDDLFWFNRPRMLLYLLNFVLFQNSFQLAFFSWTAYQFGLKSCFHEHLEDLIIRITMGVLIQILCSYVTLPLYALVTQMGSTMRPTIFNERVIAALKKWSHSARKRIKENKRSGQMSPMSSNLSPDHLLANYRSNIEMYPNENWDVDHGPPTAHPYPTNESSTFHHEIELSYIDGLDQADEPSLSSHDGASCSSVAIEIEHKVVSKDFSFDKRPNIYYI